MLNMAPHINHKVDSLSSLKARGHILQNRVHVIDNGESTSFWNDFWVKNAFPQPFALFGLKEVSIARCWNVDYEAWDLGLRPNLNDDEVNEWSIYSNYFCPLTGPR